jgi:hypothetical protein
MKYHKGNKETRVAKIMITTIEKPVKVDHGCLKAIEPTIRCRTKDIKDASQVLFPSVGQSRREQLPVADSSKKKLPRTGLVMVPTLSVLGKPLMPCHPARARELIKQGRAVRRWYKGIFSIKLKKRVEGNTQQIVVGIDPGSKREAFSVVSKAHTYLNILSDAPLNIVTKIKCRAGLRKNRRYRNTPCRKIRINRNQKGVYPSVKSRWQIKLNILNFLKKIYPITDVIIEDIKAKKRSARKWDVCFSPIEIGKKTFYSTLKKDYTLYIKPGFFTKKLRENLNLKKSSNKKKEVFNSHNIDSWVLANYIVNGHAVPDMTRLFRLIPLQLRRRQLHLTCPKKGYRRKFGGTLSLGFKRGSVVKHSFLGLVYVGGTTSDKKISLHNLRDGKRITRHGWTKDIKFLYYNSWRSYFI